jgi:hypothetical protein
MDRSTMNDKKVFSFILCPIYSPFRRIPKIFGASILTFFLNKTESIYNMLSLINQQINNTIYTIFI